MARDQTGTLMTETTEIPAEEAPKKSKMALIAGLAAMILAGGGGFFALYSGLILGGGHDAAPEAGDKVDSLKEVAFVPIQPLVVSLGPGAGGRFLHFTAQVEVEKAATEEVTHLLPRIVDVLNGYLRAVETRELSDPDAIVRLRAQMLRRAQLVTNDKVRDLLITEFVIN